MAAMAAASAKMKIGRWRSKTHVCSYRGSQLARNKSA
jgi:hypothetical protein